MSSIDERIVRLEFDNVKFEANIKATITSLDNLNKSLKFDSAIGGISDLDKASKKLKLNINTDGIASSEKDVVGATSRIGSAIGTLARLGKTIAINLDTNLFKGQANSVITTAKSIRDNLSFGSISTGIQNFDIKEFAATLQAALKSVIEGIKSFDFREFGAKLKEGFSGAASAIKSFDYKGFFNNLKSSATTAASTIKDTVKNFDFRQFGSNVKVQVGGAISSLSELHKASQNVDLTSIATSVDAIRGKFEGLSIVGIAALGALGAKAATVGASMAKSMLIDMPKAGLQEYETNLNSIQTILANTQSKGSTLQDVNGALAELNEYSDKTIYNFSEMARNIGTFTAAGVDLDTSTNAIKGISNLAALSGSNSQQASTAMYQLSQAMSSGKVSLMDWNSVVNAGMGGEVFQTALKDTARQQGIAVDGIIKKNGSFRESLQEGWLTTEVMTKTLSKFTGDLTDDQLKAQGYTKEQIADIQKLAKTANDAATKVKTFSQLTSTLNETSQSGWAVTAQLILGDFEQAKAMWTSVNDTLGAMVTASADARNKVLGEWNKLGGRDAMIASFANVFKILMGVVTPIRDAFRELFPPTTGKQLYDFTVLIQKITEALIPGATTTFILKNAFRLLFGIIKIGVVIVGGLFKIIGALIGALFMGGEGVSDMGKSIGDFIGMIADAVAKSTFIQKFMDMLVVGARALGTAINIAFKFLAPFVTTGLQGLMQGLKMAGAVIAPFVDGGLAKLTDFLRDAAAALFIIASAAGEAARGFIQGGLETALTRVRLRLESFGRLGQRFGEVWDGLGKAMQKVWARIQPLLNELGEMFSEIGKRVAEVFTDVDFNDVIDMVNVGLLGGLVLMFKKFFKDGIGLGTDLKDGFLSEISKTLSGSLESIDGVLKSVTGTLEAMQQNLQADTLMKIATAIALLAAAVVVLSLIDSVALTKALGAIAIMFFMLNKSMDSLNSMTLGPGMAKVPLIAGSMILLAGAILILSGAVSKLAKLDWNELAKGLVGVGALLMFVSRAAERISANPANLMATGAGLVLIAVGVRILADAVQKLADIPLGGLLKGLGGVGALLAGMAIFTNNVKAQTGMVATGASMILFGVGLMLMAEAVGKFADMNIGELIIGLGVLYSVLAMTAAFSQATANNANILKAAAAMVILGAGMYIIGGALKLLGMLSWEELAKGLVGMALALGSIAMAMSLIPTQSLLANAVGMWVISEAILKLSLAFGLFAGMSWETIAKGIVVLGASLLILAVGLIMMQGTVPGAAALIVAAFGLATLLPVIMAFSLLSWDQLLIGLAGLAGVLLLIGVAGLLMAPIVPAMIGLGVAIGLIGIGIGGIGLGMSLFVGSLVALAAAVMIAGPAITNFVNGILALIPKAMIQFGLGIAAFASVLREKAPVFFEAMVVLITTLLSAIDVLAPRIAATLAGLITTLLDLLVRSVPEFVDKGMKIILGILRGVANNIQDVVEAAVDVIVNFLRGLEKKMPDIIDVAGDLIITFIDGVGDKLPDIIQSGVDLIINFVEGLSKGIRDNSERMSNAGLDLAGSIVDGMVNGITNGIKRVGEAAVNLGSQALGAIGNFLGINSPSKEFRKIGDSTWEGMELGIGNGHKTIAKASEGLGQAAIDGTKKALDINSPSKEFQKLGEYTREGFLKGLMGTQDQSKAAYQEMRKMVNDVVVSTAADIKEAQDKLATLNKNRAADIKALKKAETERAKILKYNRTNGKKKDLSTAAVDKTIRVIKRRQAELKATELALSTAKRENTAAKQAQYNIIHRLQDEGAAVAKLAGQHDILVKKVEDATKVMEDAKKVRDDYRDSLKTQFSSRESIDENTRIKTYFKNLERQIEETKVYAGKIEELRKLGLNDTLYKELLSKGADAMPFIKELIAGGKGKVQELNKLQTQLDAEALKLGNTAASNLYQAGVDSAAGIVKGLEKQRDAIAKEMEKISMIMINTIKKNLGIKSPSREMAKVGSWAGEGVIVGLNSMAAAVGQASADIGDSAIEGLKQTINEIGEMVLNDMDTTPVIRPVLDLTDIKANSSKINSMLGSNGISVASSFAKADTLAVSQRAQQESLDNASGSASGTTNEGLTFIQNNNSPVALTRSEIYRQTKNQLSVAKGVLTP